jgi:hypothetical protein
MDIICTPLVFAGESILICKPNERLAAKILANCELPPVKSCLFSNGDSASLSSSMKRAILEVSAVNVALFLGCLVHVATCCLLTVA